MWQGLGDIRKNKRRDRGNGRRRKVRTGYYQSGIDAWSQVPLTTKILLAVLGSLSALFLLLILIRLGPALTPWPSNWGSLRWFWTDELLVPTPRPGALVAVPHRDTKVYSGPGENYETIGILRGGQRVEIVEESPNSAWWAIQASSTGDGLGWISAKAASLESASGAGNGRILPGSSVDSGAPYLIALANAEIQARPSTQSAILGYLENGQRAEVLGVSEDGQWWAIKMPYFESGRGWVVADKVKAENTGGVAILPAQNGSGSAQAAGQQNPSVTTVANVNIRSGPGMNYEIIGLLEYGQSAEVTGIDPERFWLAIKIPGTEGQRGWISVSYIAADEFGSLAGLPVLEPRPEGGASNVPIPAPGAPMLTALYVVNIRSGPGTQYDILGNLVQGQQAEIVGVSADGLWWIIRIEGGNNGQGWVASKYVKAENTAGVPILK